MAVPTAAPAADAACEGQRPRPSEDPEGALLGVSVDGTGVPMMQQPAATRTAQWGTGAKRPQPPAALVGGRAPVDPQPRSPEALAESLVEPAAVRARRPREDVTDEAPRAPPGRRLARLVRTTRAVRDRLNADAERRDPQHGTPGVVWLDGALGWWRRAPPRFKPWTRVTCGLDILPVVGSLWAVAHALGGDVSKAGKPGVQPPWPEMRRGRGGYVIGGRRHRLTQPRRRTSVPQPLTKVLPCVPNHRRWRP